MSTLKQSFHCTKSEIVRTDCGRFPPHVADSPPLPLS